MKREVADTQEQWAKCRNTVRLRWVRLLDARNNVHWTRDEDERNDKGSRHLKRQTSACNRTGQPYGCATHRAVQVLERRKSTKEVFISTADCLSGSSYYENRYLLLTCFKPKWLVTWTMSQAHNKLNAYTNLLVHFFPTSRKFRCVLTALITNGIERNHNRFDAYK